MRLLKVGTATTVKFGPFLDAADGVTEETAITPVVELAKDGGAFGSRSSTTAISHDAEGWYDVPLDATDTGTLGPLVLKAQDASTHLPVYGRWMVVPAHVYDGLVPGSDFLQVDAQQIGGSAPDSSADIADAVWQEAVADHSGIAGSTAEAIARVDVTVSSRSSHDDPDPNGRIDAAISSRMAATATERAAIADAILQRNLAGGSDGGRNVRDALRALRNRVELDRSNGTFTVYQEDDATAAFSGSLTTAAEDAITDINPA